MSDCVRPHRRQLTRLPHPWDSPGKNTGVDCHFILQCMKVKSESEVAQSFPTPSNPMGCSLPGSSFRGIFQARVLEWGVIAFSRGSFQPRDQICISHISCIGRWILLLPAPSGKPHTNSSPKWVEFGTRRCGNQHWEGDFTLESCFIFHFLNHEAVLLIH